MPTDPAATEQPRPPVLRRAHVTGGRARLRIDKPAGRKEMAALSERLAALPGVARVVVRPNTGSVILHTDGAAEPVLEAIGTQGIARVLPPLAPPPVRQAAQFGMMQIDAAVQKRTEGALDGRTLLAILLLLGAAVQLARGKVAGPATNLAALGLSLLDPGKS
jgi:hypothetical protein